jgi:adenylate cyclase
VDALTGYHLWAERYDGEWQDIFTLQDKITRKIITSLAVQLKEGEERPMGSKYTSNTDAWDYYVRARELFRQATKAANQQARDLLEQAIVLDPKFARAYATLAATHRRDWLWVWSADPEASQQLALAMAQRAVTLDDALPHGYKQLAMIYVYQRQHDQAIDQAQKAVDLDPNDADSYAVLAEVLNYAGEYERAIQNIQMAQRLDPYHSAHYPYVLGQAYYLQGEYQKAEEALMHSLNRNPQFMPARAYHAAVYMELGLVAHARAEMEVIRKVISTPAGQRKSSAPFRDPAITDHLRDLWRRAEGGT